MCINFITVEAILNFLMNNWNKMDLIKHKL